MIDNMPEKTGKSLEDWFKVLSKQNFEKHGQAVNFLKKEHSVTHGFANTIVALHKKQGNEEVDLVATQYRGKEGLLPIYKALDKYLRKLGKDVQVVPKKGSISYIRKRQFALVKPATKTRIDLGLKIKDQANSGKLGSSGPFGTMCTHRIQLAAISDIDQEVKDWLRLAYDKSV